MNDHIELQQGDIETGRRLGNLWTLQFLEFAKAHPDISIGAILCAISVPLAETTVKVADHFDTEADQTIDACLDLLTVRVCHELLENYPERLSEDFPERVAELEFQLERPAGNA